MSGSENKKYSIKFISEYIDASIVGDADLQIDNIATLDSAVQGCVTFLANSKYNKLLESTKASAVIVKEGIKTNNETDINNKQINKMGNHIRDFEFLLRL